MRLRISSWQVPSPIRLRRRPGLGASVASRCACQLVSGHWHESLSPLRQDQDWYYLLGIPGVLPFSFPAFLFLAISSTQYRWRARRLIVQDREVLTGLRLRRSVWLVFRLGRWGNRVCIHRDRVTLEIITLLSIVVASASRHSFAPYRRRCGEGTISIELCSGGSAGAHMIGLNFHPPCVSAPHCILASRLPLRAADARRRANDRHEEDIIAPHT